MDWQTDNDPSETDEYLISIDVCYKDEEVRLNYIAHYDHDKGTWHKYDPFCYHPVGHEIPNKVLAWKITGSNFTG